MITFLKTFFIVGIITAALILGAIKLKGFHDKQVKQGKLKEDLFHEGVNHYNYLVIFFLITVLMFTSSYLVYFSLDGTFSDGTVKNMYTGGLIFGFGSIIVGAICKWTNALVLKLFELLNKCEIENDDKITRNEEKTVGMIVLIMLAVLLHSNKSYVETYMCIAMIISYFSWIIPNWEEIKKSFADLFQIGVDTIVAIGIVGIITVTLLKVGTTHNIVAGLLLGITVNLFVVIWIMSIRENKKKKNAA